MKIPAPIKFVAIALAAYLIFSAPGFLAGIPIPGSLVSLYMFFVIVTLLLAMTATDDGADRLFGPFKKILLDGKSLPLVFVLLLILPSLFAYKTYTTLKADLHAPAELRVIHPTPPRRLAAFGKKYNLSTLENPYRKIESDLKKFRPLVKEGGVVYFKNCVGCHGALLDGRGHLAGGLSPAPLPFIGSDTIAQLKESYLFWRIVKGGAGLPVEARPRMTAMPAWEDELSEEDVWKVILFLYDQTGNRPRAWKGKESVRKKHVSPLGRSRRMSVDRAEGESQVSHGRRLYQNYCWWCHGKDAFGDGPAADNLMPPPRDLTDGTYKFKTTPFDDFYPSEKDVVRAIKEGLSGTAMPAWEGVLGDDDITDLAAYLKELAAMESPEKVSIDYGKAVPSTTKSIASGKKLFDDRCTECHGEKGRGNTSKSLKDDWGFRTWPGNLTRPDGLKRSNDAKEVYARITTGIAGTQMPSFADPDSKKRMTMKERWDVANFVMSLKVAYKRADGGQLVAVVKSETLPFDVSDPLWDKSLFKTFNVSPESRFKDRLLTPTFESVSIKALYNDKEVAILFEWDDPTKSVPGMKMARKVIGREPMADTLGVRFSDSFDDPEGSADAVKAELRRPLNFDGNGVSLWASTGERKHGVYLDGSWRVVVRRPLGEGFSETSGLSLPVAVALRDGSNMEQGRQYVTTGWLWFAFEGDKGAGRYLWPMGVFLAAFIFELLWLRGARRGEKEGS